MHKTTTIPSDARTRRTWAGCACRYWSRNKQYSKWRASNSRTTSWNISIHSANRNHDRDCPHSACVETFWSIQLSLACCSKFLAKAVEASLSLTRGAGGTALSPNLQLRRLVPYDSPAFALLQELSPARMTFDEHQGKLSPERMTFDDIKFLASQQVQTLRQMFQDGKASPYDVTINGYTLLHVSDPW